MATDLTSPLIIIGVLVVAYFVLIPLLAPLKAVVGAGATAAADAASIAAAIGAIPGDVSAVGSGAYNSVLTVGEGIGGFFGLNNDLAVQEQWAKEAAYNAAAANATAAAQAQVTTTTTGQANSSTATTTGAGGVKVGSGSYNELMAELNAYDPIVAPYMTLAAFNAMIARGLDYTHINTYSNAIQANGSWPAQGTIVYLNQLGVPLANAAAYSQSIGR